MRLAAMNWTQAETYLRGDDRCIVPLGSTEQHAQLSLATDSILSERLAVDAAMPLGIPVFPVLAYGVTPQFMAYPGTVTLRLATYLALVTDILDSLRRTGFRRILFCNAHAGNIPAGVRAIEWMAEHPECRVRFHNWWIAPQTLAAVNAIDPAASHASWSENFPWTRLPNIRGPEDAKPMVDVDRLRLRDPAGARALLGDGTFGGLYQRDDADTDAVWTAAIDEMRLLLESGWD